MSQHHNHRDLPQAQDASQAAIAPTDDQARQPVARPESMREYYPMVRTERPDGSVTYTAPYRCDTCHTPHATDAEADLCCLDLDQAARVLGRVLGGI